MLAPIVRGRKGEFKKELAALRARGFTKVRVDGQLRVARRGHQARSPANHTIDVVVDRLVLKPGIERRLTESVEIALNLADDIVVINTLDGGDRLFSRRLACTYCGVSMPEMTPRAFSFNSPHGACPECQGLGAVYDFDPARLVPDESLSLAGRRDRAMGERRQEAGPRGAGGAEPHIRNRSDAPVPAPAEEAPRHRCCLARRARHAAARSTARARRQRSARRRIRSAPDSKDSCPTCGGDTKRAPGSSRRTWSPIARFGPAPPAADERLKPQSRAVRVKGRTISEYVNLPVSEAVRVFDALELTDREALIASRILREIRDRLHFLNDVGVGYLTLGRSAATLSGGEGQRIRLATQIGSNLTGVLVRARRALDRTSSARQPRPALDPCPPARSRQHRRRRRTRRRDDSHRRLRRSTSDSAPASTAAM